jgi:predicted ATP-dependent serine protease
MNVISNTTQGFTTVSKVQIPDTYFRRFKTGKDEIDEIFGKEGFIPGSTFTIAAPPGSGKTTILLQTLEFLQNSGKQTAYISGEETVQQLAFTCKRINVENVAVANMTVIEDVFDAVKANKIDMIVLDSLPSLRSREKIHGRRLEEYLSNYICSKAKELECVVVIVMHMTKMGTYKGTTLLPHSVDCNILMKCNTNDINIREFNVTKNRFGALCETAFRITSVGFDFTKINITDIEADVMSTEPVKKSKTQEYEDTIYNSIQQEGGIDLKAATQLLQCTIKAQCTLRNLTIKDKIVKSGRGQTALWTLAPELETV